MNKSYDQRFFDWVNFTGARSARQVIPLLIEHIRPTSVLDVGCGQGAWLAVWRELGVTDVTGVDGDYLVQDDLLIPRNDFLARDLTERFSLDRHFDLVQSLEVAEHLRPEASATFVDSLCAHGDIVAFSAAQPGQGGEGHINEPAPIDVTHLASPWIAFLPLFVVFGLNLALGGFPGVFTGLIDWAYGPSYDLKLAMDHAIPTPIAPIRAIWAAEFARRGYAAFDVVRPRIADNRSIDPWYRYNMIVYANANGAKRLSPAAQSRRVVELTSLDGGGDLAWRLRRAVLKPWPPGAVTLLSRLRYRVAMTFAKGAARQDTPSDA